MRQLIFCAAIFASLSGMVYSQASLAADADEAALTRFTGNADGMVGWRRMTNTGYWQPATHSMAYGAQADFGLTNYLLHGETSFLYSSKQDDFQNPDGSDSGVSRTGTLMDLTLGARIEPASGWFRPYLGAGMDIVYATMKGTPTDPGADDSEATVGFYSHAGIAFVVARHVHLGADYRLARGLSTSLNGNHGDADNDQASVFVGYSW